MKVTLKDLLRHKFPMDEAEQAILLKEISDLAKELRMKLRNAEKQMKSWQKGSPMWFETAYQHGYFVIREILGES